LQSSIERTLRDSGLTRIAGVDEAGRGPCAGPLVVAAVILKDPFDKALAKVQDSKKLSEKVREELFDVIIDCAEAHSIIEISVDEIDSFGLHKSNIEGMRRAVADLTPEPEYVLTDGYAIPGLATPNLAVWKGDQVAISISAASILAKVYRDRIMIRLDAEYPEYGFAGHKGYSSALHMEALRKHGVTKHHRTSFANVAELL
jgi:ribonuclease HII